MLCAFFFAMTANTSSVQVVIQQTVSLYIIPSEEETIKIDALTDVVGVCQWLISVINFSALKLSGVRKPVENQGKFISLSLRGNFSSFQCDSIYLCTLHRCHVLFNLILSCPKK